MDKKEIKKQIIESVKFITGNGLVQGTAGNLSIIDHDTDTVYITPSGYPYELMTEDDIVAITLEGEVVEGKHVPSSEWRLHTQLYKAFPDCNAVAHTHSPYATSFAVSDETIPFILIEMTKSIGGDIPVARFGMPATDEVGIEAVKVMKERNACLLQNHGVVVKGDTLYQACVRATLVEDVARVYSLAKQNGHVGIIPKEIEEYMINRSKGLVK